MFCPGEVGVHAQVRGQHQVPFLGGQLFGQFKTEGPERLNEGVLAVADQDGQLVLSQAHSGPGGGIGEAGHDAVRDRREHPPETHGVGRPVEATVEVS